MKTLKSVSIFTVGYLLLAAGIAVLTKNWEFLYYIIVVIALAYGVVYMHKKVQLTPGLLWALSIWGLLHMVGGLLPVPDGWPIDGTKAVFYSWWIVPNYLKFDHVVHAYGFGISTWLCWQAVCLKLKSVQPTFGVLTLCVFAGMGLGALNEIIEFVATFLIPETNVGGYANIGWDLVSNMTGCVIAAVCIRRKG